MEVNGVQEMMVGGGKEGEKGKVASTYNNIDIHPIEIREERLKDNVRHFDHNMKKSQ